MKRLETGMKRWGAGIKGLMEQEWKYEGQELKD